MCSKPVCQSIILLPSRGESNRPAWECGRARLRGPTETNRRRVAGVSLHRWFLRVLKDARGSRRCHWHSLGCSLLETRPPRCEEAKERPSAGVLAGGAPEAQLGNQNPAGDSRLTLPDTQTMPRGEERRKTSPRSSAWPQTDDPNERLLRL